MGGYPGAAEHCGYDECDPGIGSTAPLYKLRWLRLAGVDDGRGLDVERQPRRHLTAEHSQTEVIWCDY